MTDTDINTRMQKLGEYSVSAAAERFGQSLDYTKDTFTRILRHPLNKGKAYKEKNRHFGAK